MGRPELRAAATAPSGAVHRTSPAPPPDSSLSVTVVTIRKSAAASRTHRMTGESLDCEPEGGGASTRAPAASGLSILSIRKLPSAEDESRERQVETERERPAAGGRVEETVAAQNVVPGDDRRQVLAPETGRLAQPRRLPRRQVQDEVEHEESEKVRDPREEGREEKEDRRLERAGEERGAGGHGDRRQRQPRRARRDRNDGEKSEEPGHREESGISGKNPGEAPEEVLGAADRPGQDHLERAARHVARDRPCREHEDRPVGELETSRSPFAREMYDLEQREERERQYDSRGAEFLPQEAADHLDHVRGVSEKSSSSSAETFAS